MFSFMLVWNKIPPCTVTATSACMCIAHLGGANHEMNTEVRHVYYTLCGDTGLHYVLYTSFCRLVNLCPCLLLRKTLALQVVHFILIHGTALFPISQISCKMFLQLFLFGPAYFGCLFCPCPKFLKCLCFVHCPVLFSCLFLLTPKQSWQMAAPPWVCFARGLLLLKGNSFSSPLPNACSWGSSDNSGFSL